MNELDFNIYLSARLPKKVCGDIISRLKRVEQSISGCDIDVQYSEDRCASLLCLFKNTGRNDEMSHLHIGNLPIGSYSLSTFSYAIRKYVEFLDNTK